MGLRVSDRLLLLISSKGLELFSVREKRKRNKTTTTTTTDDVSMGLELGDYLLLLSTLKPSHRVMDCCFCSADKLVVSLNNNSVEQYNINNNNNNKNKNTLGEGGDIMVKTSGKLLLLLTNLQ